MGKPKADVTVIDDNGTVYFVCNYCKHKWSLDHAGVLARVFNNSRCPNGCLLGE